MKDYVIKINNVVPWRTALRAEAEAGSPYAYIDEFTDEVKINIPITVTMPKVGNSTVSICRLNDDQYLWLTSLPQVVELGSGDPFIKEIDDVTWIGSGLGLYHAIHDQTPYNNGTRMVTPPKIHSILAS